MLKKTILVAACLAGLFLPNLLPNHYYIHMCVMIGINILLVQPRLRRNRNRHSGPTLMDLIHHRHRQASIQPAHLLGDLLGEAIPEHPAGGSDEVVITPGEGRPACGDIHRRHADRAGCRLEDQVPVAVIGSGHHQPPAFMDGLQPTGHGPVIGDQPRVRVRRG